MAGIAVEEVHDTLERWPDVRVHQIGPGAGAWEDQAARTRRLAAEEDESAASNEFESAEKREKKGREPRGNEELLGRKYLSMTPYVGIQPVVNVS
jgi:hypothetical protein